MSELKSIIKIDNNFQKSINLQLDIGNENKVGKYIATESSMLIENEYMNSIKNKYKGRATIIVGPYGKGKSHLLLDLISKLSHADRPFLPVIISPGESLQISFKIALNQALERAGIKDIVVDSYYEEAINVILKWKKEYKDTYEKFKELIDTNEKAFCSNLRGCREKTLNEFKKIYAILTSGNEFNPLIQEDVVTIYREIADKLCKDYNYSGIFIVFDEFSKFIEGHLVDGFANDMKLLQDMCELANRSYESQIHITFVAHKSIKEYGNRIDKSVINEFRGVEGRLREIRYVVSSRNNYEVISKVICKDEKELDKYLHARNDYDLYEDILDKTFEMKIFSNIFDKDKFNEIMGVGCYPLTPLSVWLLSNISEKVAQNERSIFTFLSGNEGHSLTDIINTNDNTGMFIGADAIYDYFENIFMNEHDNQKIHNEWLRADYALHQTEDLLEKQVIKTVALLEMCSGNDEVSVNDNAIRLSLGISNALLEQAVNSLKTKNIIVWRNRTNSYNFKINIGIDLENEIKNIAYSKYDNVDECLVISSIMEEEYVLPKKYNMEYTMTRYFSYEFMTEDTFMKISNSEYLFKDRFADGKIIMIISDKIADISKVQEKVKKLADKRIVVLCSKYAFTGYGYIKKYMAARELSGDNEFIESNKALVQELELYIQDLIYEVNEIVKYNFMPEYKRSVIVTYTTLENIEDVYSEVGFNRLLSRICSNYYNNAPKINNEMINKNTLSAPIRKARIKIIDEILTNGDVTKYETGTSPEATIYRAVKKGIYDSGTICVYGIIGDFVEKCNGNKVSFGKLFDRLQGENIGARKGVIPIYIANEISCVKRAVVIYYHDKEVSFNGTTLNNICDKPYEYSMLVERGWYDKEEYGKHLYYVFGGDIETYSEAGYDKMNITMQLIQKWVRGLPQYTLVSKYSNNKLNKFIKSLKRADINPRDYLLEELPDILGAKGDFSYKELVADIRRMKQKLDGFIDTKYRQLEKATKELFGGAKRDDLYRVLMNWNDSVEKKVSSSVVSQRLNQFIMLLNSLNTYNNKVIISEISHNLIGMYVENWDDSCEERYLTALKEVIDEASGINDISENTDGKQKIVFTDSNGNIVEKYYNKPEDDGVGDYLINAVESTINEFGDSLEMNEKVSAMIKILEQMLK